MNINHPLKPREQTAIVNDYLTALAWMRSPEAKFRMKDKGSSSLSIGVDALDLIFSKAQEEYGIDPLKLLHAFLMSTWAQYGDDRTREAFLAAASTIETTISH